MIYQSHNIFFQNVIHLDFAKACVAKELLRVSDLIQDKCII